MLDLETVRARAALALPRHARWITHGMSVDFDFSRSHEPLVQLRDDEFVGDIPPEWRSLYFFGEQDFAEGGGSTPLIGIHIGTGHVHGLDLESDSKPLYSFNSDLVRFISTFTLFDGALRLGSVPLASVAASALSIDTSVFPQSEWAQLLEYHLHG